MIRIAAVVALGVLSGCAGAGGGLPGQGADTCNARAQQGLIGKPVTDFAALSGAAPTVRLIYPGDAVTQDARPDRLNVVFDADDRVTRVFCG